MATTKEFKTYILEQLNILPAITCRAMMGEYLLYYDGILFGGIYDNRLLIKKVSHNQKYGLEEQEPYAGAKNMYLISDFDSSNLLKQIILDTCSELSDILVKKEKKRK